MVNNATLKAFAREKLKKSHAHAIVVYSALYFIMLNFTIFVAFASLMEGIGKVLFIYPAVLYLALFLALGPANHGMAGYYLKSLIDKPVTAYDAFDGFRSPNIGKAIWVNIIYSLLQLIFGILIVPGIIFHLRYSVIYFVLRDYPNAKTDRAFKIARYTMKEHKLQLFALMLSFIAWFLLGIITLGLAFVWLIPYYKTTLAIFYKQAQTDNAELLKGVLSDNMMAAVQAKKTHEALSKVIIQPPLPLESDETTTEIKKETNVNKEANVNKETNVTKETFTAKEAVVKREEQRPFESTIFKSETKSEIKPETKVETKIETINTINNNIEAKDESLQELIETFETVTVTEQVDDQKPVVTTTSTVKTVQTPAPSTTPATEQPAEKPEPTRFSVGGSSSPFKRAGYSFSPRTFSSSATTQSATQTTQPPKAESKPFNVQAESKQQSEAETIIESIITEETIEE